METPPAALEGCLLGGAVGDALGLPAEGLSPRRQRALFGDINRHRLLFGRGMISDDTEHALLTANALLDSGGDPDRFGASLARGLRRWACLLPVGAGRSTLAACLRLLLGVPPDRSGVPSAGNGPAMRAAILGVGFGHDSPRLRALVRASTRVTHTDPRADHAALAVALCAYLFSRGRTDGDGFLAAVEECLPWDDGDAAETLTALRAAAASAGRGENTLRFARSIGCGEGVSGYVLHTVPVAVHASLRHPDDFPAAVRAAVACGGDTDTTAAITGGIVGSRVGGVGIPADWIAGIAEWPYGVAGWKETARRLAATRATGCPQGEVRVFFPGLFLRNAAFLLVVLFHGLRRLLPPY